MQNVCKKFRIWGMLLLMILFAAGAITFAGPKDVQAATKTGFQTINGKTYYIKSDGTKQKGWLTLNGNKYYFNTSTGVQQKGWMTDSNGNKRYFTSKAGVMVTGWLTNSKGQRRYFDKTTGIMKTKWMTLNGEKYYFYSNSGIAATGFLTDSSGNKRYFDTTTGAMATGWMTDSSGNRRYFRKATGVMLTGLRKISGKKYYFSKTTGVMVTGWLTGTNGSKRYFRAATGVMITGFKTVLGKKYYFNTTTGVMTTGWVTINSKKYYFSPSTGVMVTGTQTINGTTYKFGTDGVLDESTGVTINQPTSSKTIKNYLLGAIQPVGQALYVWGGGWNDSTRKGISPTWTQWYNSQDSSYDYNDYRDLSTANRAKGLDCSGFVGWAAYQVMQTKSNVGSGYTVVSGEVGSSYKARGWGTIITQSTLASTNWKLQPGDVGYNSGHTWIVIGQCVDKSVVIVHSTPQAGCQISGTPTPSGNYNSRAIALAKKYMSKFSGYTKYDYHPSSGNYIRNGNYLRWNRSTLADPDGYLSRNAAYILKDLFS